MTWVMEDAVELRHLMWAVFPPRRYDEPVTCGCECDECTGLEAKFRHKSWDEIDQETLDFEFGALPLLTSEAFWAFIPAWLMRSLDNLDVEQHKIREFTLYAIALYDDVEGRAETLRLRFERLTVEQARAIERFLVLIRDRAKISAWDRESIERALPMLQKPR